jgi:hypothetical protein
VPARANVTADVRPFPESRRQKQQSPRAAGSSMADGGLLELPTRAHALTHRPAIIATMHLSPLHTRPCWHCTAYCGLTAKGTAALCSRPGCCRVRSDPATGCVAWERAPGTDDEPGPPAGASFSSAWSPADATAVRQPPPAQPVVWAP